VAAYLLLYPTVSGVAISVATSRVGLEFNRVFGIVDTQPKHTVYTLNSDTPYGPMMLDLRIGPKPVRT
jgi:hypothetical protein